MPKADLPVLSRSERAARNSRIGLTALRVLLAIGIVGLSVYGVFGTIWSLRDASRSAAFDAAPACTATAAPAGDCRSWTTRTVTRVDVPEKGWTTVYLSGGQQLKYDGDAWVKSLTTGKAVPVLEWEGTAEALRQPDGAVLYSPNSAPLKIYQDMGVAVTAFSAVVLMGAGLLGISRLRSGRPRATAVAVPSGGSRLTIVAVLLGILGVSGFVAGIVIAQAASLADGIITGLAVYLALAAAVLTAIAIWRTRSRRRAERFLARPS